MDSWILISIQWVMIYIIVITYSDAQIWPVGVPFSWLVCSFDMSPSFFEHFLIKSSLSVTLN